MDILDTVTHPFKILLGRRLSRKQMRGATPIEWAKGPTEENYGEGLKLDELVKLENGTFRREEVYFSNRFDAKGTFRLLPFVEKNSFYDQEGYLFERTTRTSRYDRTFPEVSIRAYERGKLLGRKIRNPNLRILSS